MTSLLYEFTHLEGVETLSYFPNFLFVLLALLLIWLSKKLFDLFAHYALEYQLVKADNKAIAIAFVGYLAGVIVILEGALENPQNNLGWDLLGVGIWGIVGILLLNLAGKMNERWLLRFCNSKAELLDNRNVAVGITVAGSYLGSAMIIRSVIIGEPLGWLFEVTLTIFYFLLGQIAFYLFSLLYKKVAQYDFCQEIISGNEAAGISFAFNLVAIGVLLAIPIRVSYSLALFLAWFVLGSTVMVLFRFIVDRIIIPLEKLDEEIHKDKNWGVAFLEGCFAIAAVVVLQAVFS